MYSNACAELEELHWLMWRVRLMWLLCWHADVLKVILWHTPKGIIDEGGKELEGYLNFNISLLAPPENSQMNVSMHPLLASIAPRKYLKIPPAMEYCCA